MGKRKRGGGIAPIHGEWRRRDGQGNWSDEDTWKQRGTAAQNFGAAVGSNRSPHREGKRLKTKALAIACYCGARSCHGRDDIIRTRGVTSSNGYPRTWWGQFQSLNPRPANN